MGGAALPMGSRLMSFDDEAVAALIALRLFFTPGLAELRLGAQDDRSPVNVQTASEIPGGPTALI